MHKRRIKYLLVGDTHPEMLSLASKAEELNIDYKIALPFFLLHKEARILRKLLAQFPKVIALIDRRTLPPEIKFRSVQRPVVSLYLLSHVFRLLNLQNLSRITRQIYFELFYSVINLRTFITHKKKFIVYDDFFNQRTPVKNAIVICPLVHPQEKRDQYLKYQPAYLDWPVSAKPPHSKYLHEVAMTNNDIVVLSTYAKNTFLFNGYSDSKVSVCHIGARFINQNVLNTVEGNGPKEVLFVGRLHPSKGIKTIISLSKDFSLSCRFKILGNGSPQIQDYLQEQFEQSKIEYIFNPSVDDIVTAYSNSHIFLMPSFLEGFNIAALEAMSFGLVPVVTRNSGLPDVLKDSILEQYLIDPYHYEGIRARLAALLALGEREFNQLRCTSSKLSKLYSFDNFASSFWKKFG